MSEVHVTWLQDLQFVATDSTNHSVVMSRPGEGSVGMKPSELLLVSLAGCTGFDVVNILLKKRAKLTGARIHATGEQASDPPWPFQKIHIHYELIGYGLSTTAVEQAIRLSEEKYCSVSATLRPTVTLTWDYEVREPG
jgi:putative redox protein